MTLVTADTPSLAPHRPVPPTWEEGRGGLTALLRCGRTEPGIWSSRATRCAIPGLVALFLVNLVLTQRRGFAEALDALGGARWVWLPALVVAAAGTYVMAAVVLNAACRRPLAFRRTAAVQVAAAFTNRLAPGGLGGMATNVRYLERCGVDRSDALSTVGIAWATGIVVHLGVVLSVGLAFWLDGGGAYRPSMPSGDYWPIAGVAVAVLSAVGVLAWRFYGTRLGAAATRVRSNVSCLRQRPSDLGRLVAGSAGMTCCHTIALVVALQAFGGGVSVVSIAIVYLAATGFAAAVPVPGGVGPLETALAAGLVGLGAASGAAIAAVLVYRLATFWLPILPGALTFRSLRRHRIL